MDWQKVDLESVTAAMPSEVSSAYEAWITQFPDKAGRLGEIVEHVRTEFRDAIASHKANTLDPREDCLPVSAIRHLESLVWFSLCMEMGFSLSAAATTAANAANLYLRQIAYGRYSFTSEDGSGEIVPTGTVPARREYGTRTLAACLVLLFGLGTGVARAEWGRAPYSISTTNVVADYTPENYSITAATLYGHLAGIDAVLGRLADTNSLYGDLVALPSVVYNLMDVLKTQALYGEYREDAGAWIVTSQTNVLFWGNLTANRLLVREDGATIHGDSEILDGGLAVDGDVDIGGGMTLGGVRRDSWPPSPYGPGGETMYLPAWNDGWSYDDVSGDYCIDPQYGTLFPSNLAVCGILQARGPLRVLDSLTLSNQALRCWGDLTNGLNSRLVLAEGAIATNALQIAELESEAEDHRESIGALQLGRLPAKCHKSRQGDGSLKVWWEVSEETVFSGAVEAPALTAPLEGGISTNSAAIAALDAATNALSVTVSALSSDLAAHAAATNNPHNVTFRQIFAADPDDLSEDFGLGLVPGIGVAAVNGYGRYVGFDDGFIGGPWRFEDEVDFLQRPTYNGVGLATTNDVGVASNTWPDECRLYWPTNVVGKKGRYAVPTNFPTRRLNLWVNDTIATNVTIVIPTAWSPDREVEISVYPRATSAATARNTRIEDANGYVLSTITSSTTYNRYVFRWDPSSGTWDSEVYANVLTPCVFVPGTGRLTYPPTNLWPTTVETWIEWQEQGAPALRGNALLSAPSLSLSPLSGQDAGEEPVRQNAGLSDGLEAPAFLNLAEEERGVPTPY